MHRFEADVKGPIADLIAKYFQAAGRRCRAAHPPVPARLGLRRLRSRGRGELYERFYLSDSYRMTGLAYTWPTRRAPSMVEQFLHD